MHVIRSVHRKRWDWSQCPAGPPGHQEGQARRAVSDHSPRGQGLCGRPPRLRAAGGRLEAQQETAGAQHRHLRRRAELCGRPEGAAGGQDRHTARAVCSRWGPQKLCPGWFLFKRKHPSQNLSDSARAYGIAMAAGGA
eukprot:scaffold199268_cov18-Prasinocladus_malaysianus.AAC.1